MRRSVRSIAVATVAAAALVALLATSAGAAPGQGVRLGGAVPSWARAGALASAASPGARVSFHVQLGWRDAASAAALARAVSDPSSRLYGHYVTPARFRARYSPSTAAVAAVRAWLASKGFTVTGVPANRLYVAATGTVAQAEAAFAVKMNVYTVQGASLRAPAGAPTIPASLAGVVTGIVGLAQHAMKPLIIAPPPPGFRNGQPWSLYWGQTVATDKPTAYGVAQPYAVEGYTPAQLRGAYGTASAIARGNDGSGVTVAVIDAFAAPTIVYDVNRFSTDNGVPAFRRGQFRQIWAPGLVAEPATGDEQGWYGEETLDIEAVHSMAPGARVVFYAAYSDQDSDMDAALNWVVDHHVAQIVSNSYGDLGEAGLPADQIAAERAIFIQAACEGIGLYFSSGDNGDEVDTLGTRQTDNPASSPWVTAVGGTSLGVGANNTYLFETGWGTSKSVLSGDGTSASPFAWDPTPPGTWIYGSGGGTSQLFAEPWYQRHVVPRSLSGYYSTTSPGRVVPDVAMDGDPTTGMLVGETQTWSDGSVSYDTYRVGGTSVSCPLFAGVMALADQRARFAHGFVNPLLYALARSNAYRDIVSPAGTMAAVRSDYANGEDASGGMIYSLRTLDQTESLQTTPGYDDVTGMGSPNGIAFLRALSWPGWLHHH
jgi:subtilase family serine protease